MGREPFKSHITALHQVRSKLDWNLAMSGRQWILSATNQARAKRAAEHISEAVRILREAD